MDEKKLPRAGRGIKPGTPTAVIEANRRAALKSRDAAHARALKKFTVHDSGCWEWAGRIRADGYGRLIAEGRGVLAHRWFYEKHVGPIPAGMVVCHRCDNPPCVNPAHLFVGTQADNVADMHAKGRARFGLVRGATVGTSKLSESDVRELRSMYASGIRRALIAERFGVSTCTVWQIGTRQRWAHID